MVTSYMMWRFMAYLSAGIFFTAFLTPIAIRFALKLRVLDAPNGRKIHKYSKPRVGGLAMFLVYVALLCTMDLSSNLVRALIVGSILIVFLGFLDDLFNVRALSKLGFQLLVAYLITSSSIGFGIQIKHLSVLAGYYWDLGVFAVPFSMAWIVGVMNAINLIDGLDGLAGGICVIASLTMGIASLVFGHPDVATIFFLLVGVMLGFLR